MSTFPYQWTLADGYPAPGVPHHGTTVFSTFACGGGSTMGYKLAGYDVIGCNEIDPQMMAIYRANHRPKLSYREDIRSFLLRDDLPEELYQLDILDGSPPCSVFSTAGKREEDWGKEKVFREGQVEQRLDDLFFSLIALAKRLQPKVFLAENVHGMLLGHAKGYLLEIKERLRDAGYRLQLFHLNAASMGVPQMRERVFFIGHRLDLDVLPLRLTFREPMIPFHQVSDPPYPAIPAKLTPGPKALEYWQVTGEGQAVGKFGSDKKVSRNRPCFTIRSGNRHYHYREPRFLSDREIVRCGSFPTDYHFLDADVNYVVGMSVPPVMMAQIAYQVYVQWFSHIGGV